MRKFLKTFDPGYLVAALLPLIGILPAMSSGVINTADGPLHVQRIYAMAQMLGTGNLWPRWVPYFHLGYGYPIFNFYPPGVFHLGAWLVRLGIDAPLAFNLVAAAAWIIGSVGMYGLARHFLPAKAAILAAMLWAYAPSRLFEVWDQGSLPQIMAAALIPLLFWGMVRLAERPTPRRLLGAALPMAGIILTHQPITFIVALYAAPLAVLLAVFSKSHPRLGSYNPSPQPPPHFVERGSKTDAMYGVPTTDSRDGQPADVHASRHVPTILREVARRLVYLFGGFILAGLLTAIFLLPLALELQYVKSSEIASDTVPYLISNFLQPSDVFMQPPAMDLTDLRYELHTTLGLVGGIMAVIGLGMLVWRNPTPYPPPHSDGEGEQIQRRADAHASRGVPTKDRRYVGLAIVLAVGLLFTVYMLLEPSLPVWLTIPFFAQLRFPERFLRVGAVLIALAGGASLLALPARWQNAGLTAGLGIVLVSALPVIYPNQEFVFWEHLSAADEIRMEMSAHTWGSTSYNEFNPLWGSKINYDEPETDEYITDPLRLTVHRLDMIRQWPDLQVEELDADTIKVTVTDERMVRIRQYYFPGWAATLDGQRIEIYPEDELGMIALDVPAGEHTIELWYEGTPAQALGTVITVAALGVVGALAFAPRFVDVRDIAERTRYIDRREVVVIIAGIVTFALVNTYILAPNTRIFRYESPPDQPAYMTHEVRADFGGLFEMMGYTLEGDSTAPGEVFDVTLFWRAKTEVIERDFRPIVQLVNWSVSEAWAVSEPFFPGGGQTNVPGNYPLDRFASEVHKLRIGDDTPPYMGRILVKMVDAQSGEALRLPDGSDFLLLERPVRVRGAGVQNVNRILNYELSSDGRVDLWCASVTRQDDIYRVDLYWHVAAPSLLSAITFVHGLDANGAIVTQGDANPLNGDYPTNFWLAGQTLADSYTLPYDPDITQVGIGLEAKNGRYSVVQSGLAVADNRLLLPLEEVNCTT